LAENLNVDLSKVYDIVSKSSGNSYIFENRGRSLLTRDFDTGKSSVAIHLKDLRILNSITENMNLSDILNKTCLDFYENIDTDSKEDAISMIRIYERMEKEL
jgi:3-hydroxyisobutyrate dehydrogenase-like beta-hydroxyacid dehydrogenase